MDEIEKQYYRIGEVAHELNVNTSLVRFWETEFTEIKPGKNRRGERVYTPQDLALLREIHHLVKERGHTLPGAREEMKRRRAAVAERAAVIKRLRDLRAFLVEMRDQLPEA